MTRLMVSGGSGRDKESIPFLHKGTANEVLLDLGKLTDVDLTKNDDLMALVTKTQKTWFQKDKERWEMNLPKSLQKDEKAVDKIIHLCTQELHLDRTIFPCSKMIYDGVLFLGASFPRSLIRLDFYLQLMDLGLIQKNLPLWVLTGERSLTAFDGETNKNFEKIIASSKPPIPFPTNERDMIEFVFYYRLPDTLQVTFIHSLKEVGRTRATTESTMEAFLQKTGKTSGHFLCISNQPYVYYQETALLAKLRQFNLKDIAITCVGPKVEASSSKNTEAAIFLDTVAKILYNIGRIFKNIA